MGLTDNIKVNIDNIRNNISTKTSDLSKVLSQRGNTEAYYNEQISQLLTQKNSLNPESEDVNPEDIDAKIAMLESNLRSFLSNADSQINNDNSDLENLNKNLSSEENNLKAAEAEEKKAEEKAKAEAEQKAKAEAEEKKAKEKEKEKAKAEAEEKTKAQAEEKSKIKAETKAEKKAKAQAEKLAKAEARNNAKESNQKQTSNEPVTEKASTTSSETQTRTEKKQNGQLTYSKETGKSKTEANLSAEQTKYEDLGVQKNSDNIELNLEYSYKSNEESSIDANVNMSYIKDNEYQNKEMVDTNTEIAAKGGVNFNSKNSSVGINVEAKRSSGIDKSSENSLNTDIKFSQKFKDVKVSLNSSAEYTIEAADGDRNSNLSVNNGFDVDAALGKYFNANLSSNLEISNQFSQEEPMNAKNNVYTPSGSLNIEFNKKINSTTKLSADASYGIKFSGTREDFSNSSIKDSMSQSYSANISLDKVITENNNMFISANLSAGIEGEIQKDIPDNESRTYRIGGELNFESKKTDSTFNLGVESVFGENQSIQPKISMKYKKQF